MGMDRHYRRRSFAAVAVVAVMAAGCGTTMSVTTGHQSAGARAQALCSQARNADAEYVADIRPLVGPMDAQRAGLDTSGPRADLTWMLAAMTKLSRLATAPSDMEHLRAVEKAVRALRLTLIAVSDGHYQDAARGVAAADVAIARAGAITICEP